MALDLHTATTEELVAELKRRSIGLVLVSFKVDSKGEVWIRECKGTTAMLANLARSASEMIQDVANERAQKKQGFYDNEPKSPGGGQQGGP